MSADCEKVNPYIDDDRRKSEQVREMFDHIAPAYDFMNRAMTLGIDRRWRRRAVKEVVESGVEKILDIATGTGDLALQLARSSQAAVTGIDLSEGMIAIGRDKVARHNLQDRIDLQVADCLDLPFADASFDAATVAYGVRNFENLEAGYREIHRVLRKGGKLAVLELSTPTGAIVKPLYRLYTSTLIPLVGRLISRDSRAYSYLPESIAKVPQGEAMLEIMRRAGFSDTRLRRLTFGTCSLYIARK